MKHILYTRFDGGVSVCCPAQECMDWLSSGGYWSGRPRGFVDEQIDRQIKGGIAPWAAKNFVYALHEGGCTTAEAYAIIRDRDCGHLGTAHELIDQDDLPDRWFRDAWRRSHNGGPIYIDLNAARKIQFNRIVSAIEYRNSLVRNDFDRFDDVIEIDKYKIREIVSRAKCENELKHVWPSNLCEYRDRGKISHGVISQN